MSGTIAGGAETFFGKQKGKTIDGVLNKITVVVCVLFFVCVLAMYITTESDVATLPTNDVVVETETETETEAEAEAEVETETVVEDEAEVETETETEAEVEAE
jgi:preprotein translocase subunit SecG